MTDSPQRGEMPPIDEELDYTAATELSKLAPAAVFSGPQEASQNAVDFARVWTYVYESVMEKTRDHDKAVEAADSSWDVFLESTKNA